MATPMYMSHRTMHMLSHIQTKLDMLCVLGAPIKSHPPCQPHQMSYNSLNSHIITTYSQVPHKAKKPRNMTHSSNHSKQPIKDLEKLKIAKSKIKTLMKHLHQIAIKYLTYMILNKRKLDNKKMVEP